MLISFLIGYAIGYVIADAIAEISIRIFSHRNAKEEIRRKASEKINKPFNVLEVFIKQAKKEIDEEILEINAYDFNNIKIAKIHVTAENGTNLRVGQKF